MTCCGIPKLKLLGSREDWKLLLERTKQLAKYELKWWIDYLLPILEKFLSVFDGEIDANFWNCSYKINRFGGPGSGSYSVVNGWINNFFPYVSDQVSENFVSIDKIGAKIDVGLNPHGGPSGMTKTPFVWDYHGKEFKMEFLGGFMGVALIDGEYLTPHVGWAVGEEPVKDDK